MTKEDYRDYCFMLAEKMFGQVDKIWTLYWLLLWAAWKDL